MKAIIVSNGKIQLVLQPENELEKEAIRQLDGATCYTVADGMNILGNNISGSLLLHKEKPEAT